MNTHLPKAVFVWFWPNPSVSLFKSWPPNPDRHLLKTFNEAKVKTYLHISSSKVEFFKVFGNRSGASSCCGLINHRWVFHLRIRLAGEKILGWRCYILGFVVFWLMFSWMKMMENLFWLKKFLDGPTFFWIDFFFLIFLLCFGEYVDMDSLSIYVHIHTSLVWNQIVKQDFNV